MEVLDRMTPAEIDSWLYLQGLFEQFKAEYALTRYIAYTSILEIYFHGSNYDIHEEREDVSLPC